MSVSVAKERILTAASQNTAFCDKLKANTLNLGHLPLKLRKENRILFLWLTMHIRYTGHTKALFW
jgi:hypothetical protein